MEKLIQISSGRGPQECNLSVQYCLKALTKEALTNNIAVDIVQKEKNNGVICSVILKLKGENVRIFIKKWIGTIQWICKSPLRPQHKRKNWFIGIYEIQKEENLELDEQQIIFETMRSAGPGGQNVNKVNSAVRATYKPNGLSVQVMESRSQLENKQIAIARLRSKLKASQDEINMRQDIENWTSQLQIERGNPIRTFTGTNFTEK